MTYKGHVLVRHGKRASCRMCIRVGRKTPSGGYVTSIYKCSECSIHLCKDCFLPYHHVCTGAPDVTCATQTEEEYLAEARRCWGSREDQRHPEGEKDTLPGEDRLRRDKPGREGNN